MVKKMFGLIKRYMELLTIEQVKDFALKNNVFLNEKELDFTYKFVKKNWESILANPNMLNLERYKDNFSEENYHKIKKLMVIYYQKYGHYL